MRGVDGFRWQRAFSHPVVWFALLHLLLLNLLAGGVFLLAHLPPSVLPLDPAILFLERGHRLLWFPRDLLRWLWLGERTPALLNWALLGLHSLCWGVFLTVLRDVWRKVRT